MKTKLILFTSLLFLISLCFLFKFCLDDSNDNIKDKLDISIPVKNATVYEFYNNYYRYIIKTNHISKNLDSFTGIRMNYFNGADCGVFIGFSYKF